MADIIELEEQISKLPIGYITEKVINEKNITVSSGKKTESQKAAIFPKKKQILSNLRLKKEKNFRKN